METKRVMLQKVGGAAILAALAPAAVARTPTPAPGSDYFPNFVVQNHDGLRLKFYDDIVRGRRIAFNMMYTSCAGICPANTANLLAVQQLLGKRLGSDVFMVSLTLQPEFDRPRDLKGYMQRYGIGPGWTFLTGAPPDMDTIRRKLGFYSLDPKVDADLGQHTGMVRVGNAALDRWCMVPALGLPRQIARALLEI